MAVWLALVAGLLLSAGTGLRAVNGVLVEGNGTPLGSDPAPTVTCTRTLTPRKETCPWLPDQPA